MLKLENLSTEELDEIARQVTDTFMQVQGGAFSICFGNAIEERYTPLYHCIKPLIETAHRRGRLYTTSLNREGYAIYFTKKNKAKAIDGLRFAVALLKNIPVSTLWRAGKIFSKVKDIDTHYFNNEPDYVYISLVAVRNEYKSQGFMRQILEYGFAMADLRGVPCILDTDTEDNEKRYNHLGMKTLDVQNITPDLNWYDLVYDPR